MSDTFVYRRRGRKYHLIDGRFHFLCDSWQSPFMTDDGTRRAEVAESDLCRLCLRAESRKTP